MKTEKKFKARPIEPTPILRGEDARRFYEELDRTEANPDPKKSQIHQGMC